MKRLPVILAVFRMRGYHVHTLPFQLNIVGVRSDTTRPNAFDDSIVVFFKDEKGKWNYHEFPATTDPGTYWLLNPMVARGTAILQEGQYLNTYAIGLHRNQYYALVQRHRPVTITVDYDRDTWLDFNNGRSETGFFGINIHRASAERKSPEVNLHSAGCQVFADPNNFNFFMSLCEQHRQQLGHNYFSYTLIDLRAIRKASRKRTMLVAFILLTIALASAGAWWWIRHKQREVA